MVVFELGVKVGCSCSPFCRVAFDSTLSWGLGLKSKICELCLPSISAFLKFVASQYGGWGFTLSFSSQQIMEKRTR